MKKVPKMISTKDLLYISDMFNWHLIAAKKIEHYTDEIQDEECMQKLESLSKLHFKACDELVKLLESDGN